MNGFLQHSTWQTPFLEETSAWPKMAGGDLSLTRNPLRISWRTFKLARWTRRSTKHRGSTGNGPSCRRWVGAGRRRWVLLKHPALVALDIESAHQIREKECICQCFRSELHVLCRVSYHPINLQSLLGSFSEWLSVSLGAGNIPPVPASTAATLLVLSVCSRSLSLSPSLSLSLSPSLSLSLSLYVSDLGPKYI